MDQLDKKLTNIFSKKEEIPKEVLLKMEKTLEERKIKQKPKKYIMKIIQIAAVITIVCLATSYTVKAVEVQKKFEEFTNRTMEYGTGSINEAVENGYIENVDMDYSYQDNIGIKINSLLLSDTDLALDVDFKFNTPIDLSSQVKRLEYCYIIYDENNKVYSEMTRFSGYKSYPNYLQNFYKEHKVSYNKKDIMESVYANAGGYRFTTYTPNQVITHLSATSNKGFPKAKILKIQVYGLGYIEFVERNHVQYIPITDKVWELQVNIPDKFYQRTNIEYVTKENVEGFTLEKALVSDTSMAFTAIIDGFDEIVSIENKNNVTENINQNLKIVDENGREYFTTGNFGCSADKITTVFSINKANVTDKLYLKVGINGVQHRIELIKK